jgi:4-carboxymuconolactone decarboxylase
MSERPILASAASLAYPRRAFTHEFSNEEPPMSAKDLAADLAVFRDSYVELFGSLPPLPSARFEFSSEVNPEFLRLAEKLRAHAFYSDVFDVKTTQLILFGMLLIENNMAAQHHAAAARRAGATWEELHKIVELAAATKSLGPANQGSSMLKSVRDKEQAK